MTKSNPNITPVPYPQFDAEKIRNRETDNKAAMEQHEADLARLDREAGPEKGGN